jgi:hypothetical protein
MARANSRSRRPTPIQPTTQSTPGPGAAFRELQTYAWTRDGFKVAALIVRHAEGSGVRFTFDRFLEIARDVIPQVQIDKLWRVFYCLPESYQWQAWEHLASELPEHCRDKPTTSELQLAELQRSEPHGGDVKQEGDDSIPF